LKPKIVIVDYGMGNLLSVSRAFEHCGAEVLITASPDKIANAERLVLPGVGAFKDGMAGLRERSLVDPIKSHATSGRPFLGICLGMQMMLETSEEFGEHAGLGLIPGKVTAIPSAGPNGASRKIPHVGWNRLLFPENKTSWHDTILEGLAPGQTSVYFVHSFFVQPARAADRLADCVYDGCSMAAAIGFDRLYGCQFHPEKSGEAGLKMLINFCRLRD
jgi:glutamine amidotransferase